MQWRGRREGGNIEDRRGMSGGKLAFGGIGGLVIAVIVYFLGGDPSQIPQQNIGQQTQSGYQDPDDPGDTLKQYMDVVLTSANEVWTDQFNKMGRQYTEPTLVLFTGQTQAGCGLASSATGPFYCPSDQKVYIDLSFFNELTNRFGAEKGDFAMAYVLAHEIGHHVQHQLGITDKVDGMRQHLSET